MRPFAIQGKCEQKRPMRVSETDFLVCGSGLAGLAFALKAAHSKDVLIITKEKMTLANTPWAQGGIAAVSSKNDSFDSHINDTLRAGAGLCDIDVVRNYIEQAPDRIEDLRKWGVHFDSDLTREGGHSARRILHFEDHTGSEIHRALLAACLKHPRIQIREDQFLIDLLMTPDRASCFGAYILNRNSNQVEAITARETILATGGAGKVYLYTSNWSGASGDGVAIAWRAGARVANLEFMQFHPTCLYHPSSRNFLISEALRGEGGELITLAGEAFMKKYHELGSLAPRDIVARSIDLEIKKSGHPCVYLDMRAHPRDYLESRFPVIFKKCLELGIDISKDPIPVVPAAHYLCGGVITDVEGRTSLPGLWALGETANTGFHGANRLASNSLLECLAMAHNAAGALENNVRARPSLKPDSWIYSEDNTEDEMILIKHMWDEIRTLMWNYVGIVRSQKRLERASHRLKNILHEVREYYSNYRIHTDTLELRNIAIVADLTVECALQRKESRGIHYNLDYPWAALDSQGEDTVLDPSMISSQT